MQIRSFRSADTDALYEICLKTIDGGADGTHLFPHFPRLPGELALGACLKFYPTLAFVLADGETPVGYTVGVLDTAAFYRRCERDWWPGLRRIYPDVLNVPINARTVEQRLQHVVHDPVLAPPEIVAAYPSHLHINILPQGQGHGHGRAMIETLLSALSAAGSPGVFLGLQPNNTRAPGFYEHLGFVFLHVAPGANRRMGLKLQAQRK